jgi:hypothetical protein
MAVWHSKCLTLSGTTDLPLQPTDLHKLAYDLRARVLKFICSSQKKCQRDLKNIYINPMQAKEGD